MNLSTLALLLSAATFIASLGYHAALFVAAYLRGVNPDPPPPRPRVLHRNSLTIMVPIKNEPIDLVLEMLRNKIEILSRLGLGEVVVISDDEFSYVDKLLRQGRKLFQRRELVVIKRLWAAGGRSAALDTGAKLARNPVIMVLDADSKIDEDTIVRVASEADYDEVVVVPWRAYSYVRNRLSEALVYSTNVMSFFFYTLRSSLGLFVFPLGCGTAIPRKILQSIGFWGWGIIQDDIWLGTKLAARGIRPRTLNGGFVEVLVPSKLTSLRIQQSRWAYGTSEVFSRSFSRVIRAPLPLHVKLEMMMYMLQPAYSIPMTIALGLAVAGAFEEVHLDLLTEFISDPPVAAVLIAAGVATGLYVAAQLWLGVRVEKLSLRQTLVQLGRNAAILGVLTPVLAVYSLLGLLRKKIPYRITPKGHHEKILGRDITLFILGVPLGVGAIAAIANGNLVALAVIAPFVVTEIYALARLP